MLKLFYPKLALRNIGKNRRFYLPYLVTCVFTAAMFYDLLFIVNNDGIKDVYGGEILLTFLNMGKVIVGIFSVIFLFYTNSFLIKSRKKELGLYNILGMSKLNIAHMLIWETLITAVLTVAAGILLGIAVSKLLLLILCFLIGYDVQIAFSVSPLSIGHTVLLFAAIFFVTLVYNLFCIRLSKPVELLRGSNVGEKEPKAKWLAALLGVLALAGGYYIAVAVEDPVTAVMLFFVAVMLVIAGTYLLFTSGSIAVLKLMRRNRSYYYKAKHFTSVSGMLYRMKQNAAGLSNICILSTMVLVMISGTVCLNIGIEDIVDRSAPYDVIIQFCAEDTGIDKQAVISVAEAAVGQSGLEMSDEGDFEAFEMAMLKDGGRYYFPKSQDELRSSISMAVVGAINLSTYNRLSGENRTLGDSEALAVLYNGAYDGSEVELAGKKYNIIWLEDVPGSERFFGYAMEVFCVILSDENYDALYRQQKEIYKDDASEAIWEYSFNLSGSDEQKLECFNSIRSQLGDMPGYYSVDSRTDTRQSTFSMYGGLLFIGIFLGLLFIGFTALMIYYKQISEGYEDRQRFQIMEKVGMSKAEVKKSINSQVLKIFFLPLIAAVIHLAFAYKIITKLLALLGMVNHLLFIACAAGTVAVFALVYFLIFHFTARTYYKIVNS